METIVTYETDEKISIVTLNRPAKLNAISKDMRTQLSQTLRKADEDAATCVVVLRAEGRSFCVGYDISGGDPMMRDTARFHFGFTVPYVMHNEAAGVIAAVARSFGDLGMLRVDSGATAGAWWMRLVDPAAPKVIARLPFVERPDHPAGIPVFVIARPLAEAAARGVVLHAVSVERWRENIPAAIARLSGEIIGNAGHGFGLSLLIALPGGVAADELRSALAGAGVGELRLAEIGSHAARFEMAERAGNERYRAAE